MHSVSQSRVSQRGQLTLPGEILDRWGLDEGGEVGFVDLGDSLLVFPGGLDAARTELYRVLQDRYVDGLKSISDSDITPQ